MAPNSLQRGDLFHLEIEGISRATFVRCEGLSGRREVIDYHEGGAPAARRLRGRETGGILALESGVLARSTHSELEDWYRRADRRTVRVVLLDAAGNETGRWRIERAWPCAWEGPRLDAERVVVALERLELAFEEVRWQPS